MKSVVLGGFMATGKTALAPVVAERLGLPWVDTDALVEQSAGATIAEIWRRDGERAFREREKRVLCSLLESREAHVIACGGGALGDRTTRHMALDRCIVVTLTASPTTIVARAGDLSRRPNLAADDPVERARELMDQRADAYAECHGTLTTDDLDLQSLADAVLALVRRDPIVVPLGTRTYVIDVGIDCPLALTDAVAHLAPSSLVVVTDAHVYRAQHRRLEAALHPLATAGTLVTIAPGEPNKTLAAVATIWDGALGAGIDRDAAVLAFGGGVVGDLAGFAAATLLRGVRVVQAPTTLLSMVDASVGGKTGFDHATGKNLIGAFHQPSAVVVDLANLETLPLRERRSGLAEVVKIALATDAALFERLEREAPTLLEARGESLQEIVRRAITLKARIVRDDEHEGGLRALLNLGHTLGHALEAAGSYRDYLHGEAVAAGLQRELACTAKQGWTPPAVAKRTGELLTALGLSIDVSPNRWLAARGFVLADKKRAGATIRLPVVRDVGNAALEEVPSALVLAGCEPD